MLLAASATARGGSGGGGNRVEGPGPGPRPLSTASALAVRVEGPSLPWKPLDGPGLVPRSSPPTYSHVAAAQGHGDKSKSQSGILETV